MFEKDTVSQPTSVLSQEPKIESFSFFFFGEKKQKEELNLGFFLWRVDGMVPQALWQKRVDKYWDLLSPKISPSTLRNIMDMRAHLGSFAAALRRRDVWVMNVVPEDEQHHLKVVYDRGLIGSVHDWSAPLPLLSLSLLLSLSRSLLPTLSLSFLWGRGRCEAYSTYPRTYDLLHAWEVVSEVGKRGCSPEDLLLEMDRILRPTGFALFRDRRPALELVSKYLAALRWETVAAVGADADPDLGADELVLLVQKSWVSA